MHHFLTLETSNALAQEINDLVHNDKSYAQCLELVAQAFGYASLDEMQSTFATGDSGVPPQHREEMTQFWQSPRLSEFITDYACRRQPVVLSKSNQESIIIAQSSPSMVFEIGFTRHGFTVFDLGVGPYLPQSPFHFRIPIDTFPTIEKAFASLSRMRDWDW